MQELGSSRLADEFRTTPHPGRQSVLLAMNMAGMSDPIPIQEPVPEALGFLQFLDREQVVDAATYATRRDEIRDSICSGRPLQHAFQRTRTCLPSSVPEHRSLLYRAAAMQTLFARDRRDHQTP